MGGVWRYVAQQLVLVMPVLTHTLLRAPRSVFIAKLGRGRAQYVGVFWSVFQVCP